MTYWKMSYYITLWVFFGSQNTDDELWKHPQNVCNYTENITDYGNKEYKTKICKEIFHKSNCEPTNRKKRSATDPVISIPRMWSLMSILRSAPNTPPRITTSELFVGEDMDNIHNINGQNVINYEDDEFDSVHFTIIGQPVHGFANITGDGKIYYLPNEDFYGVDFVTVRVVESGLLPPFHPLSSNRNITINIEPVNDAPVILPFESQMEFEELDDKGRGYRLVNFLIDGNLTRKYELGHVTFYDVDFIDPNIKEINYTVRMNNTLLSNYTFSLVDSNDVHKMKSRLSLSLDQSFYGRTIFTARGFDQSRFTTKNLEVNVYILISPCIHGDCINETATPCNDRERSLSFEKYSCNCHVGYAGEWCQTDINECDPNPCSVFYDCEDLIGYQKCNLNVAKTILLTFGVILILVMCFAVIRRNYRRRHPIKIDPGSDIWDLGSGHLGQHKDRFVRPSSGSYTDDLIRTSTSGDDQVCPKTREITVGIGASVEKETDSHISSGPQAEKRIWLLSEKTLEDFSKTLEPLSALTTNIGQKAPHHHSMRPLKENVIEPKKEFHDHGDPIKEKHDTTRKLKPLNMLKIPGHMKPSTSSEMEEDKSLLSGSFLLKKPRGDVHSKDYGEKTDDTSVTCVNGK